jgi:hypothetical protein
MSKLTSKLGAIARYELLMAWRRRSLPILWMLLLAGVVGFALLVANVNRQQPIMDQVVERNAVDPNAPEWAQGIDIVEATHTLALINVVIAGMVFFTVGVTLMMGEVIPLDRQFKIRELLDTLPLNRTAYLSGKLVSVWLGLMIGTVVTGVGCAVALHLIFGAYDLRVFAALWIALLLPTSFIASAISVLAGVLVGTRRGAVLVDLAAMPFVLILVFMAVPAYAGIGALIEPIYGVGVLMQPGDATNAEIVRRITNTTAIYTLALLVVWTFAWLDERRRESR